MLHQTRILIFALLFLTGCEDKPLSQTTVEFEGVQFPVPEGWMNVKPEKDQVKAQINHTVKTKSGDSTNKVDQVIRIEVGTPGSPKLPAAHTVAKAYGGTNPQEILLDGTAAIRIDMQSENLSKPRHIASTYHNGKAYLIMASAAKNVDAAPVFDQVLATWKWTKK